MTPGEFVQLVNLFGWPGLIAWAFQKPMVRTEQAYQELQRAHERERAEWQQREIRYLADIAKWQRLTFDAIGLADKVAAPPPGSA